MKNKSRPSCGGRDEAVQRVARQQEHVAGPERRLEAAGAGRPGEVRADVRIEPALFVHLEIYDSRGGG